MLRTIGAWLCAGMLSWALPVAAEQLDGLYRVVEPVTAEQQADKIQALQQAFDTLLLRLSGEHPAKPATELKAARNEPEALVRQYAFLGEGEQLRVDVEFDPLAVQTLMKQAELPLWGSNRPALLTWWLTRDDEGTSLVGDALDGADDLQGAAAHRGLPLRLPLADLEEQLLIADEPSSQSLRDASLRYGADGLLLVKSRATGGSWQAEWQLWQADLFKEGSEEADTPASLRDQVFQAVAAALAPLYAVVPGKGGSLLLELQGADLGQFAALERLLEPFSGQLQQSGGNRLVYEVQATPEQIRAQMALGGWVEQPAPEAVPAVDAGLEETPAASRLYFQLQGVR